MIKDKEPCCLDRRPVAAALAVRQHPQVPEAGSSANSDFDVITTSWLCVGEEGQETWQREVIPYLDGVPGVATTIDSGVSCSQPAPAMDYEYQSVELCISGEVQVQMLQSIDGSPFSNFGAAIPTGKICGQGEYVGQICYEDLPGYVTTVATTGFVPNGDVQANSSSWTYSYNGSGNDINVGRISASIRALFGAASNFVARITDQNGNTFDSAPVGGITGVFQNLEFVWSEQATFGPGETLEITFIGTGSVRLQVQTGIGGSIQSTNPPVSRPIIRLDSLLPAEPKREAYGLRGSNGVVTYYDTDTNAILVAGTYVVCPPLQESIGSGNVRNIQDTGFELAENSAGQTFPVAQVAQWSLTTRGADPISVDFGDGNVVSVLSGDTLEFGDDGENRGVSQITFSTGANSLGLVTYGVA